MDHYERAEEKLSFVSQPKDAALIHAVLALVDRIDYLTYLMYGDDDE